MQKIKTHFEQIPVVTVKQLVENLPPADDADAKDKHAAEDWPVLAQRAQHEPDTDKMIELLEQVIVKFDEEKVRKSRASYRARDRGASQM
jgi:phage terminase small subunit